MRRSPTHLRFIEAEVLKTRKGHAGVEQVDVTGLVAAAFTHRHNRAGDPDLHTHVAVANKVQTLADAQWRAIDGRAMHKAITAASETSSTALEAHLGAALGVRFVDVLGMDGRRRVREIAGVDPGLVQLWSTRRREISARAGELGNTFHNEHGRPPNPGGAAGAVPAGHLGDPRGQARAAIPQRAASRLVAASRWPAR